MSFNCELHDMPLMGGDSPWIQNIAIIITLVCVMAVIFFVSYYSWHTSSGVVISSPQPAAYIGNRSKVKTQEQVCL